MTALVITQHAAERYVERVAPAMTLEQARAAIRRHEPAMRKAAAFGCSAVILPQGGKLILHISNAGISVVTVKEARAWLHSRPARMVRRFGKLRRGAGDV